MILNNFAAKKFQLVELKVPAGFTGSRIYFADQPNLRNKIIEKIEVYNTLNNAPSGLPTDLENNTYFTFANDKGNEFLQNISSFDIIGIYRRNAKMQTFNGTFLFTPQSIVFTKSFISFPPNSSGVPSASYSVCVGVYYK